MYETVLPALKADGLPPVRSSSLRVLTSLRGGETWWNGEKEAAQGEESPANTVRQLTGMAFSGNLLPNLRRLFAGSSESYSRGWQAVREFHHNGDIVILVIFSTLPITISKLYHRAYYRIAAKLNKECKEYEQSKISTVGRFFAEGGRIASAVYTVELVVTFMVAILSGVHETRIPRRPRVPPHLLPLQKVPGLFANCAYGIWLTRKFVQLKATLLKNVYANLPDPETYDRLMDFLIYTIASILILESSKFDLGALVKSLIAVGGLSSLVVTLALREPMTQLLQGALMMAANKFRRGESIQLGDGTSGKVIDIGLLETTIVGGDNIQVKIPNSKIAGQKFSNVSRIRRSQIKFDLRFHLHDINRIDQIIAAIRQEVSAACPKLVTDGSRPFRVLWTNIGPDHLVVTVDTHHDVPPACNEYWETRQRVLFAISNATKSLKAKFAMPITVQAKFQE